MDKYHKDCNEVMKEADIFPIEVDLSLPTLRCKGNPEDDDDVDDENSNDEENDNDLINDDQQIINFNQQQIGKDVDLLNIGP